MDNINNINIIKNEVTKLLENENSGHGMEHINRVVNIALKINEKENANSDIVISIALLHDADDYKIFGQENATDLPNTKRILDMTTFSEDEKNVIINSIKTIGYSKRMEGIVPEILEARVVSDADMIDAMGAVGILRAFQFNNDHNKPFFDKNVFPNLDMSATQYKQQKDGTAVNHLFEKILKLKDLMLTESGKEEALIRYNFIIEFLKEYFYEVNAPEWIDYLKDYTEQRYIKF